MSTVDLAIAGGDVVTPDGVTRADILIAGETILAIEPPGAARRAARVIDATGNLVLPGGVDVHTHFLIGFMGQRSVYDFASGSAAALSGGTTTVVDFALQRRGRSLMDGIKHRRVQADRHVDVDYGLHLIVTDVNPSSLAELPKAIEAGVTSIKVYMVYEQEQLRVRDGALLDLLRATGAAGMLVGVHAENADIIDHETARRVAAGETSPRFHALTRPPAAEREAIARALLLAEEAGAPLYIFHMSIGAGADLIERARARGVRAFGETCPHYLALTIDAYERPDGHLMVMSPPLRTVGDQDRLWRALKTGSLAAVASDDASYSAEAKALGMDSFATIANGVPGVEARLPILYTLGVLAGRLTLPELVELWSAGPARLFGLTPRKGTIAPGADADLVIIDPRRKTRLTKLSNYGPVGYSPYEGMEVGGVPLITIRRGAVLVEDGRYIGRPGGGRFLPRALPDTRLPTARH
jgi:dihydropyrimidinase